MRSSAAPPPRWADIDPYIEGFERAYRSDGHAEIAEYLPPPRDPLYPVVLRELVRADLEYHWSEGSRKRVEDYLQAFPSLVEDQEGLSEIAFEEYRLRRRAGESPSGEEYLARLGVYVGPPSRGESPAAEALPEVGTVFLGFRLVDLLGVGAFGRVFLARQIALADRPVVLKVSEDHGGELRSLTQLQHTNIVPVYSSHEAGPLRSFCMPYFGACTFADAVKARQASERAPASGKFLVDLLRRRERGRPAAAGTEQALGAIAAESFERAVLGLAAQLADALAHAHERGIIHRDLKPANILLADDGRPMLLDFNLSADTKVSDASLALIGGTLPYMAPESLAAFRDGGTHADARGDLYALGLILVELLCGRHPFPVAQGSLRQVLDRAIAERCGPAPDLRAWNPALSPSTVAILNKCLEPDPSRRYQSAADLAEDLRRQLASRSLRHAPEPSLWQRVVKWARRHPSLTSGYCVGAVLGTSLLAFAAANTWQGRRLEALTTAKQYREFEQDVKASRALLNSPSVLPGESAQALTHAWQALKRYRVLDDPNWKQAPAYAGLSADERATVRDGIVEALLYIAGDRGRKPNGTADPEALRLNAIAGKLADGEELALLVRIQKDHLTGLIRDGLEEIPREPETPRALYLLGTLRLRRGDPPGAARLLRKAVALEPQDPFAHFALGQAELLAGRPAKALASLDTSLALRPGFHRAHYYRAGAHAALKEYEEALADYAQTLQIAPSYWPAYADRARVLEARGDLTGAMADLTQALDMGASMTRLYFVRARLRQQAGDLAGAAADRKLGLETPPRDDESWVARGLAKLPKAPAEALEDFREALRLNPYSVPGAEAEAHALSEWLKRPEDAIAALSLAIERHPDRATLRSGRGVLQARKGRVEDALRDAKESLALDHSAEVAYQVAGIYALTSRSRPADRARALNLLGAALMGGYGLDLVDRDPELIPVRDDPDFRRMIASAKSLREAAP